MTDHPEVVTGAVVLDAGEVFLMRSPKWEGKWTIPGGHVEYGERLAAAVSREVREETGLEVTDADLLSVDEAIEPPTFDRPVHFVFCNFRCAVANRSIDLDGEEAVEATWLPVDEAVAVDCTESVESLLCEHRDELSG